jgi:hypothetical protein
MTMRKGDSENPEAKPKSNFGLTAATIFVALTSVLVASTVLISGGTSDAKNVGWPVDGTATCVAADTPGDYYVSPVKADWEYTKWGMTPQEVVSASGNLTKQGSDLRPDSDGNVSKLVAPYRNGKFLFEAQFGFDVADRLASVTLVLKDKSASMDMGAETDLNKNQGQCSDLQMSLSTAYGPPQGGGTADMLYSMKTWQDQKNKTNVNYTVLYGTGCYVQYSAIKSTGAL